MTTISASEPRHKVPLARGSRINFATAWVGRNLVPFFTAVAVVALSVTLVITIYLTQADLQWTAFLLGVLLAAVLALVTQNIKAQWRLVRRSAQLRRSKELLTEEIARTERAVQGLKMAEQRFGTVLDALPAMIFFVDREERCRNHNAAFQSWCGRTAEEIGRLPLRDLLDAAVHDEISAHGSNALVGNEVQYEAQWRHDGGARQMAVKLLPYPTGAQKASGFYVFATPIVTSSRNRNDGASPGASGDVAREAAGSAAYLDAMEQQLQTDTDPREYLLKAIDEDRFLLLDQQIEPLAADARHANFREILLRLREEDEGTLRPGAFLEVAEHYRLMPAIDRWVVRKLLRSSAEMKQADGTWRMPLYGVNISNATLSDRGFANHVRAQLQHWEIAGGRLCFEIDDAALEEHENDVALLMDELKPLGCLFTADGFGKQRVSFAPFRRLRFDFVKIDGSIIGQMIHNRSALAKVGAIVLACRKIGVRTIAQSVEDDAARMKLKEIGIDYVQGFGIENPVPHGVTLGAPVE